MRCKCRNTMPVRRLSPGPAGNPDAGSSAKVNETPDRKDKLKVLKEMWEEAKRKKSESVKNGADESQHDQ